MNRSFASIRLAMAAFALIAIVMPAIAEAAKNGPDGTWKWTVPGRDGGAGFDVTAKLKVDGEKLTGTVTGRDGKDTAIDEGGKFADGKVTFSVTREVNGAKRVAKYEGKLDGDARKGTVTRDVNGTPTPTPWEAKREAAKPA